LRRPGEILLALAFRPEIEEDGCDLVISKRQQSAFKDSILSFAAGGSKLSMRRHIWRD